MKGLFLLFIAVSVFLIGWGYASSQSRRMFGTVIRKNLLAIVFALLVVSAVAFFSVNTTMRLI